MTQYIIQVGSWTKLPNGKVQEDTRDIMKMMAEKVGGEVENHIAPVGNYWNHVGIAVDNQTAVVYDGTWVRWGLLNHLPLFIPYEELQKILNQKEVPTVTSLLNTKLDCRKADGTVDEELSRAFQEACFEQGILWAWDRRKLVSNLDGPFIYVTDTGLCQGENETTFKGSNYKQINFKYSRTLTWEIVEITHVVEEDEMVSICGVEYSAKELSEALALIKSARK
jgi:hypothetical protein